MESLVRFPMNTFGLRRKRLYQPRAAAQAAMPLLGFRDKSGCEALPQSFPGFQIGQIVVPANVLCLLPFPCWRLLLLKNFLPLIILPCPARVEWAMRPYAAFPQTPPIAY
jgi:hypothetical protein